MILNNISFRKFLKSHFYALEPFLRYKSAYRNYLFVILNILKKKYPIKVIHRNGKIEYLNDYYEIYLNTFDLMQYCTLSNNVITISHDNFPSKFSLHLGNNGGDIYGIFFNEEYKFLSVKGKIIIDIGANIGDSIIYFALRGAKKIIALEPYPKNFEVAQKNIEENKLENKVDLLLAGCSNSSKHITVNSNQDGAGKDLKSTYQGKQIQLLSLEELLNRYNIQDEVLLKIDCEGCEYDIILSTPNEILKRFSQIIIEYHYGYKNLKMKLEKCGFNVTFSDPTFSINLQAKKIMYYGYIYAEKSVKSTI